MPRPFTAQITGMREVESRLAHLSAALQTEVGDEVEAAAQEMTQLAKQNLRASNTADQGLLNASFLTRRVSGARVEWLNYAFYAAFLEFGTKGRVAVPAEWAAYAATFKGLRKGSLAEFKQHMVDWVKRKGIQPNGGESQESLAHFFAYRILKYGLAPRPFMYPAYKQVAAQLPARVLQVINDSLR